MKQKKLFTQQNLVLMGMLSAVSAVLMLFNFPIPFIPEFYKIDISELPVLIGAFAIHPLAGVVIAFLKNLLHAISGTSTTLIVGDLSNFVCSSCFVLPAAYIYHKNKTKKRAILGLFIGIIFVTLVGIFSNVYVMLPLYATIYFSSADALDRFVEIGHALNPYITNLTTFVTFAVIPFNIIKFSLNAILTILLYKCVAPFIHNYQNK